MITVSNPKVAGFAPQWAAFRGFSVLFDNPGDSLRRAEGCELLACDVERDPALGLYRSLREALERLDLRLLTNTYLFCPLPPPSYHVTVWDGANDGNAAGVLPEHRDAIDRLLAGLPAALREPSPVLRAVRESPLVARRDWDLTFRFGGLSLVSNTALLAELEPATPADAARLAELVRARGELAAHTRATYGFSPYHRYWPHVSLGYFANREHAQLALPCVERWSAAFAERLGGQTVTFAHASVYGFTDMATFFRAGA